MRAMQAIAATLALTGLACTATAGERLGVVLIHGKNGSPRQLELYDRPLAELGAVSARPAMCWSRERIYDRTYLDCMHDIDVAIDELKTRGATSIVIAGMSLGGNMALGYGARHPGLKGVVALAPAHLAEIIVRRPEIAASVRKAQDMQAEGHGDDQATFADINIGRSITVQTTPKIYLSFFGRRSAAVMPVNAARLTAPLLLVAGTEDASQRGKGYIFDRAAANPLNRYIALKSDHLGTPAAAREAVMEWLKSLAGR